MTWVMPARVSKADCPSDELRCFAAAAQPGLVTALLAALDGLGQDVDATTLRAALLAGDVGAAMALLRPELLVAGFLAPLHDQLDALMAEVTVPLLAPGYREDLLMTILANHEALLAPATLQGAEALLRAVQSWNLPIAQQAALLLDGLGLTPAQVRTLDRFRTGLIDAETPAPQVLQLLTVRIDALRRERAARIAQTLSMTAANEAQRLAVEQAIRLGQRDGTRLRRYWILGDRPCPICAPIPGLNPDGQTMQMPFMGAAGTPVGEPPLHVQCYCTIDYREG